MIVIKVYHWLPTEQGAWWWSRTVKGVPGSNHWMLRYQYQGTQKAGLEENDN